MTLRLRVPPVATDVAVALAFLVLAEVEVREPWDDGFRAGPLWLASVVVALTAAPLALRTRAPRIALLLVLAVNVVPGLFVAHTILFWGGMVPMLVLVFAVARRGTDLLGRHTWVVWPVMVLAGLHLPTWFAANNLLFGTVMYGFAWFAGRVVRRSDERRAALADAVRRLGEEHEAREAAAVAHERSRIAAEMHDVVSHAVSLMVIQAGAARLELETGTRQPAAEALDQLRAAEEAGREALTELRRSLGVLRGSRA